MKLNKLIENQYDPNSCYLKCDCGCGIVEFNYYIGEDREYYSLDFYGYMRHPRNYKYSYFEFSDKDEVFRFIDSLAQANFSHKSLQGLNVNQVQDKLVTEKGINWNDQLTEFKRGICCVKTEEGWRIDKEIPVFTEDRNYIERFI